MRIRQTATIPASSKHSPDPDPVPRAPIRQAHRNSFNPHKSVIPGHLTREETKAQRGTQASAGSSLTPEQALTTMVHSLTNLPPARAPAT